MPLSDILDNLPEHLENPKPIVRTAAPGEYAGERALADFHAYSEAHSEWFHALMAHVEPYGYSALDLLREQVARQRGGRDLHKGPSKKRGKLKG